MRFFSRSKVSILCSLTALVALVGACVASGTVGSHSVRAAASTPSFKGVMSTMKVARTIDPMHMSSSKTHTQTARVIPLGRQVRRQAKGVTANIVSRPSAKAIPLAKGQLLHNFNGIDEITNGATSKVPLEPPDEALGVGNGYVFNLVNVTGAIYRLNGTLAVAPFSATTFFGEASTANLSDPRVYYDKATNTWFATILGYTIDATSGTFTSSHVDVAVSTSGSPLGTWHVYTIDTTDAGGTNPVNNAGCPCLADYPIFGIDQYNVYLSTNEFNSTGTSFNGAQIYAISKSQLEAGKTANTVHFGSLSIAGTLAYHVQPAISYGNPNAEYFENSLDPNSTFDNRIGVWAITNRQAVTTGKGMPNLSSTVINSEAYGFPVNAVTPPGFNSFTKTATTGVVTPDFDAMQEVEYINGHLVSSLDTAITIPGDTGERDGIAWFQIQPRLSGSVISAATAVSSQGYIASQGNYLLYPHINQSADGTDAITFSLGGPNTYLSAAYAVKSAGSANFGAIQIAGAGVAPDNGFTGTARFGGVGRWGDYSAGQLDPNSNNIWLATQYIPNNGDQYANWGNRVFEVAA